MSAARDLFLEVSLVPTSASGADYDKLSKAAELWRRDGQNFSSGVAMMRASDAAWGNPERMLEAIRAALNDFEHAVTELPPDSAASIASLYKLGRSLSWAVRMFDIEGVAVTSRIAELMSELGQRLFRYGRGSDNADNYLVRGLVIATDRDGHWDMRFPDYEVDGSIEYPGPELVLNIPSAFTLFVSNREWQVAHEIVQLRPTGFTTPGLKGWRAVTLAHANRADAAALFDDAADAFGTDSLPVGEQDMAQRGGHWSGFNQQVLAKYFRARARLVESIQKPEKVEELLGQALKALDGTEAGWHSGEVTRFQLLMRVLAKLLSDPASFDADEALREYESEIRISRGDKHDQPALTFIADVAAAFREFATDPHGAITGDRLANALAALATIPTIGPDVAGVLRPKIGKKAIDTIMGPVTTWMHRSLGGIKNEDQFRKVILRLLQSGLPLYAQIRHGPIEYGKDISVLFEEKGVLVLRHYQVKCGDIDTRKWRESKDEMETLFQVELSSFQLPVAPHRTEGFLVTNGHANPHVEPVIAGWLHEQRETRRRTVEFLHLDGLVDWIMEHRLASELRRALREQGIDAEV